MGRCCTSLMTEAQLILQDLFTLFCSVRLTDRGLCNVFTVNDHNYTPAEITVIITINTSNKCSKQHCECCRVILLILVSAVRAARRPVSAVATVYLQCVGVSGFPAVSLSCVWRWLWRSHKHVELRCYTTLNQSASSSGMLAARQEWAARFIFKSLLYVRQDLPVIMPDGAI